MNELGVIFKNFKRRHDPNNLSHRDLDDTAQAGEIRNRSKQPMAEESGNKKPTVETEQSHLELSETPSRITRECVWCVTMCGEVRAAWEKKKETRN